MLDTHKLKDIKPMHAEGRVCIELKDPTTGKTVHKQHGINYVFPDMLISGNTDGWANTVSKTYLAMTDSAEDIDTKFPYIIGNIIGYGIPSTGSSGLLRGAYSVPNQVLAQPNGLTSLRWKFQYDFTPSQANGTIRRIGLTDQYSLQRKAPTKGFPSFNVTGTRGLTCDGRSVYSCTTAGIITKTDTWFNTSETIDVSATVGTTATDYKYVGYAPATGKMYILRYSSSTAANRRMFVFTDNTFSTPETSYTTSNITSAAAPLYVHGNYFFNCGSFSAISYADFVNNVVYSTYTVPTNGKILTTTPIISYYNAAYSKYIVSIGYQYSGQGNQGCIFDMEAKQAVGELAACTSHTDNTDIGHGSLPLLDEFVVGITPYSNQTRLRYFNSAIAMKKLDVPVVKTSANGMTVTYELEVFW